MAEGWEQVLCGDLEAFLVAKGLGSHVEKLVEVTEAECVADLKLLDCAMVEDVVRAAGLKIVSAQKLRLAVAELRGEASAPPVVTTAYPTPAAVAEPVAPTAPEVKLAPEEVVVLCIDRSGSMRGTFFEAPAWADAGDHVEQLKRTRMEAVKQMFYAFRDRTESLGRHHELGLVEFDDRVATLLAPTPQLDLFECRVDDLQPRGMTAIYSAVAQATELLAPYAGSDGPVLRVVALTDGQNNNGIPPEAALAAARNVGAVVDAIIVGEQPDSNLRRIVAATGGECWQIRDCTEGFELLEAESVVSVAARGGPRPVDETVAFDDVQATVLTRPAAAKAHRAEAPPIGKVQDAAAAAAAPRADSGGVTVKRICKELKQVAEGNSAVWMHSGEGVHIFPAEDDLRVWRCLIEGPPGSPYENGIFHLSVRIPENYPLSPPNVRFETPCYHCNISESGQICMDILSSSWSPSLTVAKALEAIRGLLRNPDTNDALRQWVAEITLAHMKTGGSDTRYVDEARAETAKHASVSVDEWKRTWGCS